MSRGLGQTQRAVVELLADEGRWGLSVTEIAGRLYERASPAQTSGVRRCLPRLVAEGHIVAHEQGSYIEYERKTPGKVLRTFDRQPCEGEKLCFLCMYDVPVRPYDPTWRDAATWRVQKYRFSDSEPLWYFTEPDEDDIANATTFGVHDWDSDDIAPGTRRAVTAYMPVTTYSLPWTDQDHADQAEADAERKRRFANSALGKWAAAQQLEGEP